jgi:tetratricopeptide (TPR) repeat protein
MIWTKKDISTVVFDKELHSSKQYVLYKTTKNEYWKKYHLAYYYYDKNELNKAITTLQTAISGKKNINKEVFALTAMVYYELKEFEKAQDYAQKALDIDGNNTKSLIIMGDYAFRNQKYSDAQKYYKKASSNDDTYSAQVKLAKTYQKLNNIAKAKEIYSKILKISSRTFEAYYQMALLEKDREIAYLKKAIAINPNFKDAWIDLARISINKNDYENAASFLGVAKYIDDNDSRYYYYNGLVLKNKGLTAEAKKSFEQSVNLDPENNLAKEELNI